METLISKICTKCFEDKLVGEFHRSPQHHTGLHTWCKSCFNEYRRNREYVKLYGITAAEYAEMLFLQAGVCAICKGEDDSGRRLAVDHDHETGEVRGLLCRPCNLAIGHFRDSPIVLESALKYLTKEVVS